jgi:hypothetical protein
LVTGLGDGDLKRDRLTDIDPVVIDVVEKAVDPVRQLADRRACHALRIVDQLGHIAPDLVDAIMPG